jgi:tetratricopeptide (TPR) repeat protein
MRRTIAIICFLVGIAAGPLGLRAQGVDSAQQEFVDAFLGVRKGEDQERAGDMKGALASYRLAANKLSRIKQEAPNWQTDLVDFRLKRTMEAVDRIQSKLGGSGPGVVGDAGLLPPLPLEDPLKSDTVAPVPAAPSKHASPLTIQPGQDPLDVVKQRIAELESRLNEANQKLRDEQEKNTALTKDIGEAMAARKKAEDARKKAQDLADIYQKSVLDLKSKGDANSERVKELEAKLDVVNRATVDTQAELSAAEERISQLLGRSRAMAEKAGEAAELPAKVKKLQEQLDEEKKSGAVLVEAGRKREEGLKSQIALLTKERGDSVAMKEQLKDLQAKLDAEQKATAAEAAKTKKREEDLQGQIASLTKERNEARQELARLKDLNKQTDKLMADNASLLKKLGEAEKQIVAFKADAAAGGSDVIALKKKVADTAKALTASTEKNSVLQAEIGELQKKVGDYSKQIAQFKADKSASLEERRKMEDENKLLQGIVMRVLQEDANRAQRKKMVQNEINRLQIQSEVLLQQINYLTQPVVRLSSAERKLFKKPVFDVQDPNTLVAVKTEGVTELPAPPTPPVTPAQPATTERPPVPENPAASAKPPVADTKNPPLPEKTPVAPAPEPAKPAEMVKLDTKPAEVKPKPPEEMPAEAKSPGGSGAPGVGSLANAKLSEEVKPLAEQAKQAFDREKFVDAEKLYDKALQMTPNNVYLLSNRAVVQFRMGKYKQAEESFKKALAIAPEDAFCWSTIGIVYYSEEKYDEAVTALTKSLAINPRNATAHNYLGITAAQKGWLEAAEKELETAIQLDPKYGDAWFNLAVTQTLKQPPNKAEASKAYRKAIELGAEKDLAMEKLLK